MNSSGHLPNFPAVRRERSALGRFRHVYEVTLMNPDSVLVACVAENRPDYHIKVANLVGTLRSLGGSLASVRIMVHYIDTVDPGVRELLEQAGVEVRITDRIDPRCPHANKLRMLEGVDGAEILVAMDVDMAVARDFRLHLHARVVGAKVVDINPLSEIEWRQLYDYAGLTMPGERYVCTSGGAITPPYFNSGLIAIPVEWIASLRSAWGLYIGWLLDAVGDLPWLERHAFFTDQLALALALQAIGCPRQPFPIEMNFPTHLAVAPAFSPQDVEPCVLHYHDRMNADGTLAPTSYRSPNLAVQRVNAVIQGDVVGGIETSKEGFINSSFWERRYCDEPALGSGAGSRAQFARYKRVLLDQLSRERSPDSVLDVGCGDLASVTGLAWSVYTGIDIAEGVIERNRAACPDWRFLAGDFLQLTADSELTADLVLCMDVLIHEHDAIRYDQFVERLLGCALRCLVVGGYESPPPERYSSAITAFHEPLSDTLRRHGVVRIVRIGGYRGVTLLRVDLEGRDAIVHSGRRAAGNSQVRSAMYMTASELHGA